jgi:four helix bundle protein
MRTDKYDLEERLIAFSVMALEITERLPQGARHLARQLERSATSPALNYGEAQSAESPKDFLHVIKRCLKELRESQICLRIIKRKPFVEPDIVNPVLQESSELVAIFTASVETKKRNIQMRN